MDSTIYDLSKSLEELVLRDTIVNLTTWHGFTSYHGSTASDGSTCLVPIPSMLVPSKSRKGGSGKWVYALLHVTLLEC